MALGGSVAWVTGAGSGIGLAGARELALAGAHVVLSGRRADALERGVASIRANGGSAEAAVLDVRDAAAVEAVVQGMLARHKRIDILVNSAGLNNPVRFWRDQTIASWDEVVGANLSGTFYCVRAVLPAMRAQKGGIVINIASWAGRYTMPLVGAAYNGSKHAVVSLSETINMEECGNGIRACALCPAEVATPIMDRRPVPPSAEERARMLQPEDLGRTIRWVAEQPANVCINEILLSPTANRIYLGGIEQPKR
ncbi:MAG TPA: SDR family oxidoreductase [Burkholderiaceae bacterium]|nr:SDR family oxidoreductase [Burkholderiaceae bacterium]